MTATPLRPHVLRLSLGLISAPALGAIIAAPLVWIGLMGLDQAEPQAVITLPQSLDWSQVRLSLETTIWPLLYRVALSLLVAIPLAYGFASLPLLVCWLIWHELGWRTHRAMMLAGVVAGLSAALIYIHAHIGFTHWQSLYALALYAPAGALAGLVAGRFLASMGYPAFHQRP